MSRFEITLPGAFPDFDDAAQTALIESAQRRITALKTQQLAWHIAQAFDAFPKLETLVFFIDEDRDGALEIDYSCNRGSSASFISRWRSPVALDGDAAQDPQSQALLSLLEALTEEQGDADCWGATHSVALKRPASGPVAPALFQALLPPEAFAAWQASQIERAASARAAPTRPSTSL